MIILDASGSMWGQIDGKPKIVIAREVLDKVIGSATSTKVWLGLMAYGHREKGSCADIEILYSPAPGSGPEIAGTARDINPKGKTPLSDAVRMAAEQLKYTEQKATVILITDGLETCNADPCALARELEKDGVDFTTHVVGFGLSPEEGRQVACLADETGGTYFQAANADGLADALATSVAEAAVAPEPEVEPAPAAELPAATLAAPDTVPMGTTFTITWDGPGEQHDVVWIFDPKAKNGQGALVRGRRLSTSPDYDKRTLSLVAPTDIGTYELQYHYGKGHDVIATRAIEVVPTEVSLDAPATVDIGATFTVAWVGPGANGDAVQLFDEAAGPDGKVIGTRRLINSDYKNRTVDLPAPVEPGFYLLRYWNGDDRAVLASRQIEVLAAEVSLSAPETVPMGTSFDVGWVGPGDNGDAVQLFDPRDGPNGKVAGSKRVTNGDFKNRTVTLIAPIEPGDYVVRYFNGDHSAVLAERPFTVTAMEVTLAGPGSVAADAQFKVTWAGPGANGDAIQLFDPGANKVVASKRLINDDYKGRSATLRAPKSGGNYVLRYFNGDSRTVLAEQPIVVQ